jgi:hypothetical protein
MRKLFPESQFSGQTYLPTSKEEIMTQVFVAPRVRCERSEEGSSLYHFMGIFSIMEQVGNQTGPN